MTWEHAHDLYKHAGTRHGAGNEKKTERRPEKYQKTCTQKHNKAHARALATLSSSAALDDLALGAALLGARAHAVEDVVEGTCALPARRGRGRG